MGASRLIHSRYVDLSGIDYHWNLITVCANLEFLKSRFMLWHWFFQYGNNMIYLKISTKKVDETFRSIFLLELATKSSFNKCSSPLLGSVHRIQRFGLKHWRWLFDAVSEIWKYKLTLETEQSGRFEDISSFSRFKAPYIIQSGHTKSWIKKLKLNRVLQYTVEYFERKISHSQRDPQKIYRNEYFS